MGLTIHYDLRAPADEGEFSVRERLAALRNRALQLPTSIGDAPDSLTLTAGVSMLLRIFQSASLGSLWLQVQVRSRPHLGWRPFVQSARWIGAGTPSVRRSTRGPAHSRARGETVRRELPVRAFDRVGPRRHRCRTSPLREQRSAAVSAVVINICDTGPLVALSEQERSAPWLGHRTHEAARPSAADVRASVD